jgi:hypothetical protein
MLTIRVGDVVDSELYNCPVYISHIRFVYDDKFYDIITVNGDVDSHTYAQLKPKSVRTNNDTGIDFTKFINDYIFVSPSDE